MKSWKGLLMAAVVLAGQTAVAETARLTALERSQGWRLLFDGESLSDWRGYHQNKVPTDWRVAEGSLTCAGGAALVTTEDFKDFEIVFDWKVAAGGSASVYFRALDDASSVEGSGPVMELAGDGVVMAGNGGLSAPWRVIPFQADVWYRAKISVFGNQVEYSINNERVQTYLIDSPDWRAAVAASRFKGFKDYGLSDSGRIVLAGKDVAFRNIKIRAQ